MDTPRTARKSSHTTCHAKRALIETRVTFATTSLFFLCIVRCYRVQVFSYEMPAESADAIAHLHPFLGY